MTSKIQYIKSINKAIYEEEKNIMEDVKKMSFPFDKSYNSRYEEDEPPQWEENQPLTQKKKKKSSTVDRLVKTVVKIED